LSTYILQWTGNPLMILMAMFNQRSQLSNPFNLLTKCDPFFVKYIRNITSWVMIHGSDYVLQDH